MILLLIFSARFSLFRWFRRHRETRKRNTLIRCCRLFVFCTISSKRHEIHHECDKKKKESNDKFAYSLFRRYEMILWIYVKVFDLNFSIWCFWWTTLSSFLSWKSTQYAFDCSIWFMHSLLFVIFQSAFVCIQSIFSHAS
jgi:hypothetical protein